MPCSWRPCLRLTSLPPCCTHFAGDQLGQVYLRNTPMEPHYPTGARVASARDPQTRYDWGDPGGAGGDYAPSSAAAATAYSRHASMPERHISCSSQYSGGVYEDTPEYGYGQGPGYPVRGYGHVSVRPPLVVSGSGPHPAYPEHPQYHPYERQYSRESRTSNMSMGAIAAGAGSNNSGYQRQARSPSQQSLGAPPLVPPPPGMSYEVDPITMARRASMEFDDDDPGTPPPDIHGGFHLFPPGKVPAWVQEPVRPAARDPKAPHQCSLYLPCLSCMNDAADKAEREAGVQG